MRAFRLQAHDEHVAVAVVQHLDGCVVEAAELLGGDDLGRLANCHPTVRDVEHAVDDGEQGVDVMRDEQHGEAGRPGQIPDPFANYELVPQVQAGQGRGPEGAL